MSQLFRVRFKESGEFIDDLWKDDLQHLESHLLVGPTGRVFWLQWDGLKELTDEVELVWEICVNYQSRISAWIQACFGPVIAADKVERDLRFLEEAVELVQANGMSRETANNVLDYVFARPAGETKQEVGGVMTTLTSLCLAHGLDLQECADAEATRIENPEVMERIRAKQAAKPRLCAEHFDPLKHEQTR